jgi:hypothetical protein
MFVSAQAKKAAPTSKVRRPVLQETLTEKAPDVLSLACAALAGATVLV